MKHKTRKLSIRMKILLPASILIVLVCAVLGMVATNSINDGMVKMGVEEAQMAAKVALNVVDGDAVALLEPGCEDTETYQKLLADLREVQENYGIAYLYTLYTDGQQVYYGVDTDRSELQAEVGQVFEKSYEMLESTFAGQDYVQEYIDYSIYGDVISIYKPITNSEGKVVAVLGSDYDACEVVKRLNEAKQQVLIIAAVCLVAALVVLGIVVGGIAKSLRRVDTKIYDLVHNEGDLTQKLDIKSGDEMELISDNVNLLLEHIRSIMLNIADNSAQLTRSSQNIVKSLSGAEMGITDVSATMEEMSAAMEETSASLNQVNASIATVYMAVKAISENANSGRESSGGIMSKAEEIRRNAIEEQKSAKEQAQQMAAQVSDKIEKSRAVEEISTLTDDIINITSQTNLLALNASIEAARAGEAGRGFAVVAEEIGKLASNSAETAAQIQQVSKEVIQAVNELSEKAEQMLAFVDETAMMGYEKLFETSENYRNDVGQMNQMMNDFAEESGNIKNSIDQIQDVVSAINIAVEESTKAITTVTQTSVELTSSVRDIEEEATANEEVAECLDKEVNKFKLH